MYCNTRCNTHFVMPPAPLPATPTSLWEQQTLHHILQHTLQHTLQHALQHTQQHMLHNTLQHTLHNTLQHALHNTIQYNLRNASCTSSSNSPFSHTYIHVYNIHIHMKKHLRIDKVHVCVYTRTYIRTYAHTYVHTYNTYFHPIHMFIWRNTGG